MKYAHYVKCQLLCKVDAKVKSQFAHNVISFECEVDLLLSSPADPLELVGNLWL